MENRGIETSEIPSDMEGLFRKLQEQVEDEKGKELQRRNKELEKKVKQCDKLSNHLKDITAGVVQTLKNHGEQLTKVNLASNRLASRCFPMMMEYLSAPKIEELNLSNLDLARILQDGESRQALKRLLENGRSLASFTARNSQFFARGLDLLKSAISGSDSDESSLAETLVYLDLSENGPIDGSVLEGLVDIIKRCDNLQSLKLEKNGLTKLAKEKLEMAAPANCNLHADVEQDFGEDEHLTSEKERHLAALVSLGDLKEAREEYSESIWKLYVSKWRNEERDCRGKVNKLDALLCGNLAKPPTIEENMFTRPDSFVLIPDVHEGMELPLSDGTWYEVRKEDKLLFACCSNNTVFANLTNEVIPYVRQLIIDLVCCNSAILDKKSREEVAKDLRQKQDDAKAKGLGLKSVQDPPKYQRSMLRRFDPSVPNSLLYALVQSGKSPEQMRLILIAWFVLGVQPIMHVQSASGRLVHGPQFVEGFNTFMNPNEQKDHLVTLGTLFRRYDDKEIRKFVGLDYELRSQLIEAHFHPTIGYGRKALELGNGKLHVPLLLANIANGEMLVKKDDGDFWEDPKYLDNMRQEFEKVKGESTSRAPVMFIFDEDDKQVGDDVSFGDSDVEHSTKYCLYSKIKSNRVAVKDDVENNESGTEDEVEDPQESNEDEDEEEEDDEANRATNSKAARKDEYEVMSFRGSVKFIVSVTATPIGTLCSKDRYNIIRQDKPPYNYYGVGNNNLCAANLKDMCEHDGALDIRMLSGKGYGGLRRGEEELDISNLSKAAIRIAKFVVPDMIQNPSAVMESYRNCLLFGSRIGDIQKTLVHLVTHIAGRVAVNMGKSTPAVFAIEFHGSGYTSGLEDLVDVFPERHNARAPLRVWLNYEFYSLHKEEITKAIANIAKDRFQTVSVHLDLKDIRKWFHEIESSINIPPPRQELFAVQFVEKKQARGRRDTKIRQKPELKHGFTLVKTFWELCKAQGTYAIGFTGSTAATDGRGVVNKDEEHEVQLTDQVLPSNSIDLTSLLQSLRVSGCVKSFPLLGKPKIWVEKKELELLRLALGATEEVMALKEEIHKHGQEQRTDGEVQDKWSVPKYFYMLAEASQGRREEFKAKYPTLTKIYRKNAVEDDTKKRKNVIKMVPSIRVKKVMDQVSTRFFHAERSPTVTGSSNSSPLLQSILAHLKNNPGAKKILQEQFESTSENISKDKKDRDLLILQDLEAILDEGVYSTPESREALRAVKSVLREREKKGKRRRNSQGSPPEKQPRRHSTLNSA